MFATRNHAEQITRIVNKSSRIGQPAVRGEGICTVRKRTKAHHVDQTQLDLRVSETGLDLEIRYLGPNPPKSPSIPESPRRSPGIPVEVPGDPVHDPRGHDG